MTLVKDQYDLSSSQLFTGIVSKIFNVHNFMEIVSTCCIQKVTCVHCSSSTSTVHLCLNNSLHNRSHIFAIPNLHFGNQSK